MEQKCRNKRSISRFCDWGAC